MSTEMKLWARLPLGEDCYGQARHVDIETSDGRGIGKEGVDELLHWIATVGKPMAAWNERQAHRAVACAFDGLMTDLLTNDENDAWIW